MTHPEWGLLIVVYLFLGGLSAGALVLSSLAQLLAPTGRGGAIARLGAFAAPFPVLLGTALLVLDLGRPFHFWKLFTAVEPESPMWIGSWLLGLFSLVSLPYAALFAPPPLAARLARPWAALVAGREERLRTALAVAGLPLGVGVGIYTGVLLGAVPARPFWNTPMVAQLFLFSALSTASALLMVLLSCTDRSTDDERQWLLRADVLFILLELGMVVPYVVHAQLSARSAQRSLDLILGGPFTALFWIGVVLLGLLVPLAFESLDLLPALRRRVAHGLRRRLEVAAGLLVLSGGFLLRYVFVYAGQRSSFL